jgi:methyl-accepting chemotaxis protein
MPIRLKVLIACLLMTAVTFALGVYGLQYEHRLGDLALRMYDESFMSVSFVRSAETRSTELRLTYKAAARDIAEPPTAAAAPQRPDARPDGQDVPRQPVTGAFDLDAARKAFADTLDDLDVAIERAANPATRADAKALRAAFAGMAAGSADIAATLRQLNAATEAFENVVEMFAEDGFAQRSKAKALVAASTRSTWTAIAVSVAAGLLISLLLTQSIVPQLRRAMLLASGIAAGKLDNIMPLRRRPGWSETAILLDALGRMQNAIRDQLVRIESLRSADEQQRIHAEIERKAALMQMAVRVEQETSSAVAFFTERTTTMSQTADVMAVMSDETSGNTQSAAAAAEQALAGVRTVTAAAEDLTTSITAVGSQVRQSSEVVSRAIDAGQSAREAIDALTESVGRIGSVTALISDIAGKTNLLALNATIEAARAGDAGKGFAVVAGEVKSLALQTARSTQEISKHISEVRAATEAAVNAVGRIEQTVGEVKAVATDIAVSVEAQALTTQEITRTVTETSSATAQLAKLIAEVAHRAVSARGHAEEVRHQSHDLAAAASTLQQNVVRVIRNSEEVNRRRQLRFKVNLPARLLFPEKSPIPVEVTDLSEGGAALARVPDMPTVSGSLLRIDGINLDLPIQQVRSEATPDGSLVSVRFELDDKQQADFAGQPEKLAGARGAVRRAA